MWISNNLILFATNCYFGDCEKYNTYSSQKYIYSVSRKSNTSAGIALYREGRILVLLIQIIGSFIRPIDVPII